MNQLSRSYGISIKLKVNIMAKGKKIELPANVDYLELVNKSIEAALADLKGNAFNKTEEDSLRKVAQNPALKQLLASAIKIAAKDGLYTDEVEAALGDVNDLIYKASGAKKFQSMIANPAAPQFKLSLPMVLAIQDLDAEAQKLLWEDLQKLEPDAGQRMLAAFTKVGEALLPIFKTVGAALLKIGAGMLTTIVHEKVGGQTGDVLAGGINDVTKALEKTVLDPHTVEKPVDKDVTKTLVGDVLGVVHTNEKPPHTEEKPVEVTGHVDHTDHV